MLAHFESPSDCSTVPRRRRSELCGTSAAGATGVPDPRYPAEQDRNQRHECKRAHHAHAFTRRGQSLRFLFCDALPETHDSTQSTGMKNTPSAVATAPPETASFKDCRAFVSAPVKGQRDRADDKRGERRHEDRGENVVAQKRAGDGRIDESEMLCGRTAFAQLDDEHRRSLRKTAPTQIMPICT